MLSQITILTGVITYNTEATDSTDSTLGSINLGIFILVWVTLELGRQYKTRALTVKYRAGGLEKIDMPTFDSKLLSGAQLVVLDDLVLEVGDYMRAHPGGSEVLK